MNEKNPFDLEQMMKQFDPLNLTQQFQEMVKNSPFTQIDPNAILDSQKKALESIEKANQTVANGAKSLVERQSEMMQQAMADATSAVQKLSELGPSEAAQVQAGMVEDAMKKSMENFQEISTMINGIYADIADQVQEKMEQNVKDLNDAIAKSENKS